MFKDGNKEYKFLRITKNIELDENIYLPISIFKEFIITLLGKDAISYFPKILNLMAFVSRRILEKFSLSSKEIKCVTAFEGHGIWSPPPSFSNFNFKLFSSKDYVTE
jgi:hypothetical protein